MLSNETEHQTEKLPTKGLGYYWPFALSLVVYGVDQYTKWLTETNLGPYGSGKETEILGGLIKFRFVKNTGASFSLLRDAPWFFALVAIAASLGIIVWYVWKGTSDRWYQFCVGLLLAGAVGNLSDRLFKDGAVTDMINIPSMEIFKNFNVADVSLNVGVATLLIVIVIRAAKESRQGSKTSDGSN